MRLTLNDDSLLAWLNGKLRQLNTLEEMLAQKRARGEDTDDQYFETKQKIKSLIAETAYYLQDAVETGEYGDGYDFQKSDPAPPKPNLQTGQIASYDGVPTAATFQTFKQVLQDKRKSP